MSTILLTTRTISLVFTSSISIADLRIGFLTCVAMSRICSMVSFFILTSMVLEMSSGVAKPFFITPLNSSLKSSICSLMLSAVASA